MKPLVFLDDENNLCVDVEAILMYESTEVERVIRECGLKPKNDGFFKTAKQAQAWQFFKRDLSEGDFEDRHYKEPTK